MGGVKHSGGASDARRKTEDSRPAVAPARVASTPKATKAAPVAARRKEATPIVDKVARGAKVAGKSKATKPAADPKPKPTAPRVAAKTAGSVVRTPAVESVRKPAAKTVAKATGKVVRTTARKPAPRVGPGRGRKKGAMTGARSNGRSATRTKRRVPIRVKPAPVIQVRVRELNPQEKCGLGTSVQRLLRVDETVDRVLSAHLVFFDRHGWYCEHGRNCPAVGHARRHAQQHVR